MVLTSATASTLTTILPGARTTLSMASHGAIPKIWARVSPRFQTPVWGTAIYGVLSIVWYVGLTLLSQNVLADSHRRPGLTIAFYYGINGFAVPLFYRHHVLQSFKKFVFLALFPLLGGLSLLWVFDRLAGLAVVPGQLRLGHLLVRRRAAVRPGRGIHLCGVVVMFVASAFLKRSKPFFSRTMETVDTMRPYIDPPDVVRSAAGARDGRSPRPPERRRLSRRRAGRALASARPARALSLGGPPARALVGRRGTAAAGERRASHSARCAGRPLLRGVGECGAAGERLAYCVRSRLLRLLAAARRLARGRRRPRLVAHGCRRPQRRASRSVAGRHP